MLWWCINSNAKEGMDRFKYRLKWKRWTKNLKKLKNYTLFSFYVFWLPRMYHLLEFPVHHFPSPGSSKQPPEDRKQWATQGLLLGLALRPQALLVACHSSSNTSNALQTQLVISWSHHQWTAQEARSFLLSKIIFNCIICS